LESWHSQIGDPAVLSVMSPEAILHLEFLAPVECVVIGFQTGVQVLGMDIVRPAVSQLRSNGTTRKLQPGLVEVDTEFVRTSHPNHHRSGVCHQPKTLFAFTQCRFSLLT